jgi:uncharacterized protein (DUF433 family)
MQPRMITSNPKAMMGEPVVTGTCITVELLLEKLAAGETVEQILETLRADVLYPIGETYS